MQFNSIQYLVFLLIAVIVYFAVPSKLRQPWLLAASYFFYMNWNAKYALLLFFSTFSTWVFALLIAKHQPHRKVFLTLCIIINLALLFYFKYFNFLVGSAMHLLRRSFDPWDIVLDGTKAVTALPIFSVLTLSATGSEMDQFAVISDMTKNEKWGTAADCMKPTMSILDPTYTFSVSKKQTAAGTADMMSHTFENYFTKEKGVDVQARFAEGLLKTMIKYGPVALAQPDNYDARANLMWAASHAINGLIANGSQPAWCVHPMEHELSAFYDITHGQGLAILTPVWMKFVLKKDPTTAENFAVYGRNVWGIDDDDDQSAAEKAIECTRKFLFETMGLPANLRAVGITSDEHFEVMAEKAAKGSVGCFVPLTKDDIVEIFRAAF